jgi:hypothetical protein
MNLMSMCINEVLIRVKYMSNNLNAHCWKLNITNNIKTKSVSLQQDTSEKFVLSCIIFQHILFLYGHKKVSSFTL